MKYRAVLVEVPTDFRPTHLLDVPAGGVIKGLAEACRVSEEYARQYNHATATNGGSTWIILVP
jgi:hypothetical protein